MKIPEHIDFQKIVDEINATPKPHVEMYNEWYNEFLQLTPEQKAEERLRDGAIYRKHLLAKKHGPHLYNNYRQEWRQDESNS